MADQTRATGRRVLCPRCGRLVSVNRTTRVLRHHRSPRPSEWTCPGSGVAVNPTREHLMEAAALALDLLYHLALRGVRAEGDREAAREALETLGEAISHPGWAPEVSS